MAISGPTQFTMPSTTGSPLPLTGKTPPTEDQLNSLDWILQNLSGPYQKEANDAFQKMTGMDPRGRYQGYNVAKDLMPLLYQYLTKQQIYANSLQPLSQNATSSAIANLSNPEGMIQQQQGQMAAQGQSTLQNVLQRLRSGGAGIGATQGAEIASANGVSSAGNDLRASQHSPLALLQRAMGIHDLANSAQPDFGNLSTLHGIETGTPRNQTGLQAAGGLLGSLTGLIPGISGIKALTGGNAGGSSSTGGTNDLPSSGQNDWANIMKGLGWH